MKNNLMVIEKFNEKFGKVRIVEINGKIHFVAVDIAKALGYKDTTNAIKQHCRWVVKCHLPHPQSKTKTIEINAIPEGDIFRLVANSELPGAEEFESWIFDEVLPQINHTGAYISDKADPEMLRRKADELENIADLNEAAKILLPIFNEIGLKPQYKALSLKQIYRRGGIELPIEEMKAEKSLYDLQSIAKEVGVYSSNNKPHKQVIGYIISQINIQDDEKEIVSFENNGHMGTTTQYTKSVIDKVKQWIYDNNNPTEITVKQNGKSKRFTIVYKEVA